MAEEERDPKLSQRYRELGREEPTPQIDAAILAAAHRAATKDSRRAAQTRPAPLVAPTGRQRWYFPIAAAAIITLAVAVTVQMERHQPDPVSPAAPSIHSAPTTSLPEKKLPAKTSQAPEAQDERKRRAESPRPEPKPHRPAPRARESATANGPAPKFAPDLDAARRDSPSRKAEIREERSPEAAVQSAPAQSASAPPSAPAPSAAPQASAPPATAGAPSVAEKEVDDTTVRGRMLSEQAAIEPPERWLERIAELRRLGRHDEADKALAEFRKRHPHYIIPPAMLEKVEKK